MKIGFFLTWPKHSLTSTGNVIGDELFAESMCRALRAYPEVASAELYAPNYMPSVYLDYLIYMNADPPRKELSKHHILYMQNASPKGSDVTLSELKQFRYDSYLFVSYRLFEIHRQNGGSGLYLPFGVDTNFFYPRNKQKEYEFDVSYVGNDIKGKRRSMLYLYPAVHFSFGLFGNWQKWDRRFWKNKKYQRVFTKLSKGKISQEDVPVLYSSSKINLNCTAQDCVAWDIITLRTFEVLACKGFLITDRVPKAEAELKDCLVFTDGGQDLREKIEYYLARPEARKQISETGYQYVTRQADVRTRANELLKHLKDTLT